MKQFFHIIGPLWICYGYAASGRGMFYTLRLCWPRFYLRSPACAGVLARRCRSACCRVPSRVRRRSHQRRCLQGAYVLTTYSLLSTLYSLLSTTYPLPSTLYPLPSILNPQSSILNPQPFCNPAKIGRAGLQKYFL